MYAKQCSAAVRAPALGERTGRRLRCGAVPFFASVADDLAAWAGGKERDVGSFAAHLLGIFEAINGFRMHGASGLQPLQPSEIEAWSRLTGQPINPWQAETLFAMDRAFMAHVSKTKPDKDRVDADNGTAVVALMSSFAKPNRKR